MTHLLQSRTLGGRVVEDIQVQAETPSLAMREAKRTRPGQHIYYILSIGGAR